MATGVVSWSQTAASNGAADANINFAEGMAASQVNDSARALMASVAKYRDDIAGSIFSGGSSSAFTVTTNQGFTSLSQMDGQTITVRFHTANAANATINVDGLGAKTLSQYDGSANLAANQIRANGTFALTYTNAGGFWFVQALKQPSWQQQSFNANGTYTPTTNMQYCIVECVGGGGGGGGAGASAGGISSGGGGGGGGYARTVLTAAQVGASQTVTIGAAGTAGATGNHPGGNGGTTSVGSLCVASGGTGGGGAGANAGGTGGAGGAGSAGGLQLTGSTGGVGIAAGITTVSGPSGPGGEAPAYSGVTYGVGTSVGNTIAGGNAAQLGAGGSGGQSYGSASTAAGGTGGAGLVVITEFCY